MRNKCITIKKTNIDSIFLVFVILLLHNVFVYEFSDFTGHFCTLIFYIFKKLETFPREDIRKNIIFSMVGAKIAFI